MGGHGTTSYERARLVMVETQLLGRGIRDEAVLAAFRKVPRERFVPGDRVGDAYEDRPVAIGRGQTVSQPYIVALGLQALSLSPGERVLEVGTGSGCQTALLAEMGLDVRTVERIPEFAEAARERLAALGYGRVRCAVGDGTLGWKEDAPYDGIVVGASAPDLPPALADQLAAGGRLVIPLEDEAGQTLWLYRKRVGALRREKLCGCVFVKLIGEQGW